ncbi:molybdopterin-dependent oxidoreductase, partial [Chloroflexota bacterium]
MVKNNETKKVRTVCPLMDACGCGLLAHVVNGVITKVEPADFPDPDDKGVCAKGLATPQLVYHPERLRYPLKRIGERGEGKWQRISWDEALDSISEKLIDLARQYGSTSIAWASPGLMNNLYDGGYTRLASLTGGTRVSFVGFGDSAGPCADMATFGWIFAEQVFSSLKNPKLTIVWGCNPAATNYHAWRRIIKEKKGGCKLIAIDPRSTETVSYSDEHIQIRPGTDGALALAMMHVIMQQGLQDEQFIVENTVGPLLVRCDNGLFLRESDLISDGSEKRFIVFDKNTRQPESCDDQTVNPMLIGSYTIAGIECKTAYQLLAEMVKEYTPERVSKITDVPADIIRRLATSYATQKPACIYRGWGMQRTFYGDLSARAIYTLAALTGNMNLKGRQSWAQNVGSFAMPGGPCNQMPVMMLYDAITKREPITVKAIWFAVSNFVNQLPNMNKIVNELFPLIELIVVCDLFMTATARYADYVLPAASFYECMDLRTSRCQNNTYLQLQ